MNPAKHIVIIGATSAIAEHCARLWAADQPASITLVGRHTGRLQAIAAESLGLHLAGECFGKQCW